MPTVQIPESHDPYVIQINDKVTSYPAGTEQVLTSDEAELVARETGSVDRSALQFAPVEAAFAALYPVDDNEYSISPEQLNYIMSKYFPQEFPFDNYIVSLVVIVMDYRSAMIPADADSGYTDPCTLVLRYDMINAGISRTSDGTGYIEQTNGTSDLSVPIEITLDNNGISSAKITLPSGSTYSEVFAYYEKIKLQLPM